MKTELARWSVYSALKIIPSPGTPGLVVLSADSVRFPPDGVQVRAENTAIGYVCAISLETPIAYALAFTDDPSGALIITLDEALGFLGRLV